MGPPVSATSAGTDTSSGRIVSQSFPSATSDSSDTPSTTATGPDNFSSLDSNVAVILGSLMTEEREYVLRLGETFEALIKDGRVGTRVAFRYSTRYQLFLIHCCSAYYKLHWQTLEGDSSQDALDVVVTRESRIPERQICELLPAELPTKPGSAARSELQPNPGLITGDEEPGLSPVEPSKPDGQNFSINSSTRERMIKEPHLRGKDKETPTNNLHGKSERPNFSELPSSLRSLPNGGSLVNNVSFGKSPRNFEATSSFSSNPSPLGPLYDSPHHAADAGQRDQSHFSPPTRPEPFPLPRMSSLSLNDWGPQPPASPPSRSPSYSTYDLTWLPEQQQPPSKRGVAPSASSLTLDFPRDVPMAEFPWAYGIPVDGMNESASPDLDSSKLWTSHNPSFGRTSRVVSPLRDGDDVSSITSNASTQRTYYTASMSSFPPTKPSHHDLHPLPPHPWAVGLKPLPQMLRTNLHRDHSPSTPGGISLSRVGERHPHTLTSMVNLASTYEDQGRWKDAEALEVVMERRKQFLGEDHPDTLTSMDNLASTYQELGRLKDAEALEVAVMEKRKQFLGEDHPDTLTNMADLAGTYRYQGRWEDAAVVDVLVMEKREQVLGYDHPATLSSRTTLAITYRVLGRLKDAEALELVVIEKKKQVLGEDHPDTLTSMARLAKTYKKQGRWKDAEVLEVVVMEKRKQFLGEDHPDTLTGMADLASTYQGLGRLKDAETLEVVVMEKTKQFLGEDHPDTLASMAKLAGTYRHQGRWRDAAVVDVVVMEKRKRVLGDDHPVTLSSRTTLAITYRVLGRLKDAEALEVAVMEKSKQMLGDDHPERLISIENLASTYKAQSRPKQMSTLATVDKLGRIYRVQGRRNLGHLFKVQGHLGDADTMDERAPAGFGRHGDLSRPRHRLQPWKSLQ